EEPNHRGPRCHAHGQTPELLDRHGRDIEGRPGLTELAEEALQWARVALISPVPGRDDVRVEEHALHGPPPRMASTSLRASPVDHISLPLPKVDSKLERRSSASADRSIEIATAPWVPPSTSR